MNGTWILFLMADAMICTYAGVRWYKLRQANPAVRLNFRLIELWAVSFALSPALALFGVVQRLDESAGDSALLVLVLLIPHQLAVAFLTMLRNHEDLLAAKAAKDLNAFQQFVLMLNSTLVGLIIPIVTLCATVVLIFTVVFAILFSPIVLPILVLRAKSFFTTQPAPPTSPIRSELPWQKPDFAQSHTRSEGEAD